MVSRVLFVLKYREQSYGEPRLGRRSRLREPLSSGLCISAQLVFDMLVDAGADAELVHVADNNRIHREVVRYGATHVVIDAFWVVPEKFDELAAAFPGVKFIVRNHSETPFLGGRGSASNGRLATLISRTSLSAATRIACWVRRASS